MIAEELENPFLVSPVRSLLRIAQKDIIKSPRSEEANRGFSVICPLVQPQLCQTRAGTRILLTAGPGAKVAEFSRRS